MKRFHYILRYALILIVFLILLSMFYRNYQDTVRIVKSKYNTQYKIVEDSVYNTIMYSDTIGKIVDEALNDKMKDYSLLMAEKYRQDPNILDWDLETLKNQLGNYDIYVINNKFKVIRTTFAADLGLDFGPLTNFSKLLEQRMAGNSFVADRLDVSTNTGALMKYSYMPTPDHKYLLELSVNISESFPIIRNLDIFSVADALKSQYKSVKNIGIYKSNKDGTSFLEISKDKPFHRKVTDINQLAHIRAALKAGKTQTSTDGEISSKYANTYRYIPYLSYQKDGSYDWWNSYVIIVTYDNKLMLGEIHGQNILFWNGILIIAAVFFIFIFIIIRLLNKSEHIAYHDHLTDLPNRKLLEQHISQKISKSQKNKLKFAVLFLDLNNFKMVNDTLGHDVGDELLQEVAKRLKRFLPKGDIISRLGGDEFVILLPGIESYDDAIKRALKISSIFEAPLILSAHEITVQLSIGISVYPDHSSEVKSLIKKADIAMYHAKKGNLNYMLYDSKIGE